MEDHHGQRPFSPSEKRAESSNVPLCRPVKEPSNYEIREHEFEQRSVSLQDTSEHFAGLPERQMLSELSHLDRRRIDGNGSMIESDATSEPSTRIPRAGSEEAAIEDHEGESQESPIRDEDHDGESPESPIREEELDDFPFDPIDTSEAENAGFCKLNFKPFQIKTWFLTVTIVFFAACIAAIVATVYWSRKQRGSYETRTSSRALALRYVPTVVGTVTTIWWRNIVTNLSRISPYMSMAANLGESDRQESKQSIYSKGLDAFYANALFEPSIFAIGRLVRNGQWLLICSTLTVAIINLCLVGLKAAFIQVIPLEEGWSIVVSDKIAYALIAIYGLLLLMAFAIMIRLHNRNTGLKWDPVSVADQLALLQGSNLGRLFIGLENLKLAPYRKILQERSPKYGRPRLGYWKHKINGGIWHGIALVPARTEISSNPGGARESTPPAQNRVAAHLNVDLKPIDLSRRKMKSSNYQYPDAEHPVDAKGNLVPRIEFLRYRACHIMVCDMILTLYMTVAIVVVALVIHGLLNGHIQHGIHINASWLTDFIPHITQRSISMFGSGAIEAGKFQIGTPEGLFTDGLKSFHGGEGFIFRFVPALFMGTWFINLWINADAFYRYAQPYAGMNEANPADCNILLDYPGCMPILITLKALSNRHWRVALFSFLSLLSPIPPVIASGIFVATADQNEYVERIEPANFWSSFAILLLYMICIPLVRPTPMYRLPRLIITIADTIRFCYASHILEEKLYEKPIFRVQEATDRRIHLVSQIHLAKKKYQFGFYLGKDGRRNLGFDVSERHSASGQLEYVDCVNPGRALYLWWKGGIIFFRKPLLVRALSSEKQV